MTSRRGVAVLVSGGLDSAILLAELLRRGHVAHPLYLRFGLEGQGQHSLSQAGKLLGVSRERVRQIQDRALEKLRAMV